MDTDFVRGRVMVEPLLRRGRYRLNFCSTRDKVRSNLRHDDAQEDTKASTDNVEQSITSSNWKQER